MCNRHLILQSSLTFHCRQASTANGSDAAPPLERRIISMISDIILSDDTSRDSCALHGRGPAANVQASGRGECLICGKAGRRTENSRGRALALPLSQ
jgi:hypothetical protein